MRSSRGVPGTILRIVVAVCTLAFVLSIVPPRTATHAKADDSQNVTIPEAIAQAAQTGQPVLASAETTESSTVVANPDGTLTATLGAGPLQEPDPNSPTGWSPIDLTLQHEDGTYAPAVSAADTSFSDGGSGPLATLDEGNNTYAEQWDGSLPTPDVSGDTATYRDVLPNVDLSMQATTTGFKQSFVVHDPPSQQLVLDVPLSMRGLTATVDQEGNLLVADNHGDTVATSGTAMMYGATLDPAGEPVKWETVPTRIVNSRNGPVFEITPDQSFFSAPGVTYPVTIDPSPNLDVTTDTYVKSTAADSSFLTDTALKVGTPNSTDVYRSLLKFSGASTLGGGNPINVFSAVLNLFETDSGSCTQSEIDLYDASSNWITAGGVTWNNQPTAGTLYASNSFANGHNSNCQNDWGHISTGGASGHTLKDLVQMWANGSTNNGVILKAASEIDTVGYKRFKSSRAGSNTPTLTVTYVQPGNPTCSTGGVLPVGPLTAPQNDSTVSGTVSLTAAPTDTGGPGVGEVDFYANVLGQLSLLGSDSDGTNGWSTTMDTRTLPEGRVNLMAYYTDLSGNTNCASPGSGVAVNVVNAAPGPESWQPSYSNLASEPSRGATMAVALNNGALRLTTPIDSLPGKGFSPALSAVYDSKSSVIGAFGFGWRGNLEDVLMPGFDGSVTHVTGDGREERFTPQTSAGTVGQYYNNVNLSGTPVLTRTDSQINFNWGSNSPGSGVNATGFSVRWSGLIQASAAGTWTFYALAKDGVRVLVDGQYIVNRWQTQLQASEASGSVYLASGEHQMEVDYFDSTSPSSITLSFAGPGTSKQVVPADHFVQPTGHFTAANGVWDSLAQGGDSTYALTSAGQEVTKFSSSGVMQYQQDRHGNILSYGFDSSNHPTAICLGTTTCDANHTKISIAYAASKVSSVTDVASRTWSFGYDGSGRLSSLTGPLGEVTHFAYDGSGRMSQATDPLGMVTQIGYGTGGVASVLDPAAYAHSGPATTFTYTPQGDGIKAIVTSPMANSTVPPGAGVTYILGLAGQVLSLTDELGHATTYTFDASFDILTDTDAAGKTETLTYDGSGRVLSDTDPLGNTTSSTYSSTGELTSETDGRGKTTTLTYDGSGDLLTETDAAGLTFTNTYDAAGQGLTNTDGVGNVRSRTWNDSGEVATDTDYLGHQTSYSYDAAGNALTLTNPLGKITTYTYDSEGDVLSETDPLGNVTTYGYDLLGRQTSSTDPVGNLSGHNASDYTTTTTYDEVGRVASISDPYGHTSLSTYDWNGNAVTSTDPNGRVYTLGYDAANRMTSQAKPDGTTATFTYDAVGRETSGTDPMGTAHYTYDADGHVLSSADPQGNTTTYTYDAAGNEVSVTSPLGNINGAAPGSYTATYAYSADETPTQTKDPLGNITSYGLDTAGMVHTVTAANGVTMTMNHDANGELTSWQRPGSAAGAQTGTSTPASDTTIPLTIPSVGMGWAALSWTTVIGTALDLRLVDSNGTTVADSGSQSGGMATVSHSLAAGSYSVHVRGVSGSAAWSVLWGTPATRQESSSYTAAGELSSATTNRGTISYSYDNAGNLTGEQLPGQVQYAWAYDAAGRPTSMTDPSGTQTFAYDHAGRPIQAVAQDGTQITYGYDAASNQTTIATGGSSFTYSYDSRERYFQRSQGGSQTSYSYGDHINPTDVTFASGEKDVRAFDSNNLMTQLSILPQTGASPSYAFAYTYDADGNLTRVQDVTDPNNPLSVSSFAFDQDGRLASDAETVNGSSHTTTFAYDGASNITAAVASSGTTTYAYNEAGQLIARTDPQGNVTNYFYDADGDLTGTVNPTGVTTLTWTPDGYLASVTKPDGTRVSYTYDASGKRMTKQVGSTLDSYSYDGSRLSGINVGGASSSSPSFTYDVRGVPLTMTLNGSTYAYHLDHEGSVIELTDTSTHQAAVTYRYDAWGNLLATTGPSAVINANPYTYVGGLGVQWDGDTGLYHMPARYYDPTIGRFISLDPAREDTAVPDYVYADDNPTVRVDPTGLYAALIAGESGSKYPPPTDPWETIFAQRIDGELAWLGGGVEPYYKYPWSRSAYYFNKDFIRLHVPPRVMLYFHGFMTTKCAYYHSVNRNCNAIGHSAGGMTVANSIRTVPMDFADTMSPPAVNWIWTGYWFGFGRPPLWRYWPHVWYDEKERAWYEFSEVVWDQQARARNFNWDLGHNQFWSTVQVAEHSARGICAARAMRWHNGCRMP